MNIDYETLKVEVYSIEYILYRHSRYVLLSTLKGIFKIKVNDVVYWEGTSLKLAVEAYNKLNE